MRTLNIALRSMHLMVTSILVGGHAFDAPPERLVLVLWLVIASGAALGAVEAGPRWLWFHQGRGLMTLAKLLLLCTVPLFWRYRLPILLAVIALAGVGAHMPARFRYYSIIYRQVIPLGSGPGVARLRAQLDADRQGVLRAGHRACPQPNPGEQLAEER